MRETDFAYCAALLRAGSRSFRAASLLLPSDVRRRATVLYAFCRLADDLVDDDPSAGLRTIDTLRERLAFAYAGRPIEHPVDRALAEVLVEVAIPRAIPEALLEGMEWDVSGRHYRTLADLEEYAARVAGTVGLMMTLAMGVRSREALARACDLGVAMQLTNVARDVGEDARNGRVYLPSEWLGDTKTDRFTPALGHVVERLLDEADVLYRRADYGIPLLPASSRVAIRAARLIYAEIGAVIARNGHDSVRSRATVSSPRKLALVGQATTARFGTRPVLGAPPLVAARLLVESAAWT